MANRNFVLLAGFLGADPVIRYTAGGTKVANVRMATSYTFTDKAGEKKKHTTWHALVFYDYLADEAETYKKGENIHIEGHIQDREFTPKGESKARTVKEIIIERSHVIPRSRIAHDDDAPEGSEPHDDDSEGGDDGWPT
jgi:single-strand DNA-binding protein